MVRSTIGTQPTVDGTVASGVFQLDEVFQYMLSGLWPLYLSFLTYEQEILLDGPVAYWRLGESSGTTAFDQLGASNGTYVGGTTLGTSGLLVNNDDTCVSFNGSTGVITTVSVPTPGSAGYTYECWTATPTKAAAQGLIGQGNRGEAQGGITSAIAGTSGAAQGIVDDGTNQVIATGTTDITDDSPHHIVIVIDRSLDKLRLYVDGVEDVAAADISSVGALSPTDDGLEVGAYTFGASRGQWHSGEIDEVAVYNYALTPSQVRRHYYRGLGKTGYELEVLSSGPISYWKLDESGGTTAIDVMAVQNGTHTGSPVYGAGIIANALTYDGTNYTTIADNNAYTPPAAGFSVECWIKTTQTTASNVWVITKGGLSSTYEFGMFIQNTDKLRLNIWQNAGSNHAAVSSTSNINDGNWHHVAFVYSTSIGVSVYIDGKFEANDATITGSVTNTSNPVLFGKRGDDNADEYVGSLDEVVFYDSVLNETDISRHYYAGLGRARYELEVLDDDPIYYFPLVDPAGTTTPEDMTKSSTSIALTGSPVFGSDGRDDRTSMAVTGTQNVNFTQASNPTQTFTYEFWALPQSTHELHTVSSSGFDGTAGQKYVMGDVLSGGSIAISMGTNGVSVFEHASNYMPCRAFYNATFSDWTHVVVTYTNRVPRIYVNGVLRYTGSVSPKATITGSAPYIGDVPSFDGFDGSIADVAVYDYVLPLSAIKRHYNAGVGV